MEERQAFRAKPLGGETVVNQVVRQITDAIIDGSLKPGDKLPTEPELCAGFGVGRSSVREAVKILEAYGVVRIRRAEGTFVNDSYNRKMFDPMLYGMLLEENFKADIIQLRKVFDVGIFHQIMGVITQEHLQALEARLGALRAAVLSEAPSEREIMEADNAFHTYLAGITGNRLLMDMYEYVDRITTPSRKKAVGDVLAARETEKFLSLHREIISLLTDKDYSRIEEVLKEHYQFWETEKK